MFARSESLRAILGTALLTVSLLGGDFHGASAATAGQSSFYGGNIDGGNCLLTGYSLPASVYGTAYSGAAWNSAGMCGGCLNVVGPNGKSIKVMVVDKCPECPANKLDLFQSAFVQLSPLSAGIISISYDQVACGITSPIRVRNKVGSSKYWFSMQAYNSNLPVRFLEVSADGGRTWQATVRQDYNYFQKSDGSGVGVDRFNVRVTCTNGRQVTVSDVDASSTSNYQASGNC